MSALPSKTNLRHLRRIPCSFDVLLESLFERIEATSVDISENGIRLSLPQIPRTSPHFSLVFKSGQALEKIEVVVGMVWITENLDSNGYLAGFNFLKISKEDRQKISKYINDELK